MDVDKVVKHLLNQYAEDEVLASVDEQISEYTDDDWADTHDSEYDWYMDHGNKEAEGDVLHDIVTGYEQEHGKLGEDDYIEVVTALTEHWGL